MNDKERVGDWLDATTHRSDGEIEIQDCIRITSRTSDANISAAAAVIDSAALDEGLHFLDDAETHLLYLRTEVDRETEPIITGALARELGRSIRTIRDVIARLGYPKTGRDYVLSPEQVRAVIGEMHNGPGRPRKDQ